MPIDYGGGGAKWLRLPKVGETSDFSMHGSITKAEKVEGGRFNFERRVKNEETGKVEIEDLGYHIEYTFEDDTKLSVSSWKPFFAFKDADIQEGDAIKVKHPAEGEWSIEKMAQGEKPPF